jgi:hypothetical protein
VALNAGSAEVVGLGCFLSVVRCPILLVASFEFRISSFETQDSSAIGSKKAGGP